MAATLIAGVFGTGKITQRGLPVKTGGCEVVLNGAGTISASLRLPAVDPYTGKRVDVMSDLVPGRSFLAYVQDGRVLNAGPIWSEQYDSDSQILTLSAAGARSILDYRFVLPILDDLNLASTPTGTSVTVSNTSLRTIAKRLVQNAVAAAGGAFPIDFEDDIAGTNTRTYLGEAMKRVGEALSDLSGVISGPEIMLVPYLTADANYVRWRLVTGSTEIRQTGNDWVWDTAAPVPNATGVNVSRSATSLATTAFTLGAQNPAPTNSDGTTGTSTSMTAKRHDPTLINAGFPRMEYSEGHTDATEQATLQGYSDSNAAAGRYFTDTLTVKSRVDLSPTLAEVAVGDYAQIKTKGHPMLTDGTQRVRVLSISASRGESTASIACAPIRTAAA